MCSNRAATRVNILNCQEKSQHVKSAICRNSASSRTLQQPIVLTSHGRGRWFEPSIAHSNRHYLICPHSPGQVVIQRIWQRGVPLSALGHKEGPGGSPHIGLKAFKEV